METRRQDRDILSHQFRDGLIEREMESVCREIVRGQVDSIGK